MARRVICLLCGVWLLDVFDLALTVVAHRQGRLEESNPIAARVLPMGEAMLLVYKTLVVAGGSAGLLVLRGRFIAEFASAAVLVICACVAVSW